MNSREHQAHQAGQYSRKRNTDHFYQHKSYNHGSNNKQLSKQQFIQANCQFVVIGGYSYDFSAHLRDPDLTVPWEYIEQVRFRQTGCTEIICPICLSLPNAAQITTCGHIYCFSCVLHFLAVTDDKKCPVCFGQLKKDDLKSVVAVVTASVSVGDDISLRLTQRRKGRVDTEPYDPDSNADQISVDWSTNHHLANLIIVDPIVVVEQITLKEQEELSWRLDEKEDSEICFVEQAMDILNKRLEKLYKMAEIKTFRPNNPRLNQVLSGINEADVAKNYLFYQYNSEHVYLNPFCTKILCHEFGRLEDCPREVAAKIVGSECVSMTEATRRRYKYLEHLPLSCEFRLVEVDLKHLISSDTYDEFKHQIKSREKERERRIREEQKRDKIIEVQQNRKIYGIMPALDISLDSREQFPSVSGGSEDLETPETAQDCYPDHGQANNNPEPAGSNLSGDQGEVLESQDEPMSSFEAIQRQEERMALTNNCNKKNTNLWAAKSAASNQSTFAKLLVGAGGKTWTKNTKEHQRPPSSQQIPPSKPPPTSPTNDETQDDQVRAPPCEFTISDFLKQNVTKNPRKPKNQPKKS